MTIDTQLMLDSEEHKTFFISDRAMTVIGDMFTRTREVGEVFGYDSKVYIDMATSLNHCLSQVLTRTGFGRRMTIAKDGELSLFCNEDDAFVFGMVFFRDRTYDNPPAGKPQPGTWSLHS